MLFYVPPYQTKYNQKEESCTYHNICLALSKRIKRQQDILIEKGNNGIDITEEISKDYCEGLSCMLSSPYGHTTNNVLNETMSWKLFERSIRFRFSREYVAISLTHLPQWLNENENLEFKLRQTKTLIVNIVMCMIYK